MSEYALGTVAMVTAYNHSEPYRAFFDGLTWRGAGALCVDTPTSIRPLVVIDLAETTGKSLLPDWLRSNAEVLRRGMAASPISDDMEWIADQIEAQTRDPKPAEPLGLGAVVEDANGEKWVHDRDRKPGYLGVEWLNVNTLAHRHYESIDAVRILSEGVSPC